MDYYYIIIIIIIIIIIVIVIVIIILLLLQAQKVSHRAVCAPTTFTTVPPRRTGNVRVSLITGCVTRTLTVRRATTKPAAVSIRKQNIYQFYVEVIELDIRMVYVPAVTFHYLLLDKIMDFSCMMS